MSFQSPLGGINSLPDHEFLEKLLKFVVANSMIYCQPCQRRSAPRMAEIGSHCCIKCEEFLCENCAKEHMKNRADHVTSDVSALQRSCHALASQRLEQPRVSAKMVAKFGGNLCSSSGKGGRIILRDPSAVSVNKTDDIVVANADGYICAFSIDGTCKKKIELNSSVCRSGNEPEEGVREMLFGCASVTAEGYLAIAK